MSAISALCLMQAKVCPSKTVRAVTAPRWCFLELTWLEAEVVFSTMMGVLSKEILFSSVCCPVCKGNFRTLKVSSSWLQT